MAFSEYLNFRLEKGMFFFKMCLLRYSVFVDYRGQTNLCQKNSNYSFKYAADISNNSINEFSRYNTSSKLKVRSNEHYLITYVPYVTRVLSKVIIRKSRGGRFLWNRNWGLGCSDAGRWKTLRGPVVIGEDNLPSPVRIGLTNLSNIGFLHHWIP